MRVNNAEGLVTTAGRLWCSGRIGCLVWLRNVVQYAQEWQDGMVTALRRSGRR